MSALELAQNGKAVASMQGASFADTITFEEWAKFGTRLAEHETALRWSIGDWMLYGAERFGTKAILEGAKSTIPDKVIAESVSVARRIPTDERHEQLSFWHHREVATLTRERRDEVLTEAAKARTAPEALRIPRTSRASNTHAIVVKITGDVTEEQLEQAGDQAARAITRYLESAHLTVDVEVVRAG